MDRIERLMAEAISVAFKTLLSEKHLYQTVTVEIGFLQREIECNRREVAKAGPTSFPQSNPPFEQIAELYLKRIQSTWVPQQDIDGQILANFGKPSIRFTFPTIVTFCPHCKNHGPFNPEHEGILCIDEGVEDQCICFRYRCQYCKGLPIRFMVRRHRFKLTLSGRDPMEILPTPKELPKAVSKYFADAHLAHNAGQTLPGLFMLRVFIEQYWRTIPRVIELVKKEARATGDQQGGEYQKTLPEDFKSRFPSLPEIYGKLSVAIHSADPNCVLFEECSAKIVEHFEARRVFRL